MSNYEKLFKYCEKFSNLAFEALEKTATAHSGNVCVPAAHAKDKKDHFPINDEAQARNALARVNQFSSVPPWYNGDLKSLINTVYRKVKAKYPSIKVDTEKKKPGKG